MRSPHKNVKVRSPQKRAPTKVSALEKIFSALGVLNGYFYSVFYRSLSLYIVQYTMISWAFVKVSSRDFCLCYRGVFFVIVRYHDFLLGVGFLLGFKWRGLGDIGRHTIGGQSVFIPTKTKRHFKKFRKKTKRRL